MGSNLAKQRSAHALDGGGWRHTLTILGWGALFALVVAGAFTYGVNVGQMSEKETICHQLRTQAPNLPVSALEGGPCRIASDR